MKITRRQAQLVQETMKLATPSEVVADLFYRRLFTLDPALRALFHDDMEAQGKKLMAALALVAHNLEHPERLLPVVRRLGQRHVSYGVQPEDYRPVGGALLWALAQVLGEAFTPEVEEAWAATYRLLASIMQEAAMEVASGVGLSCQSELAEE